MHSKRGSAAVARRAMPKSAVVASVHRCIQILEDGVMLARTAAAGPEPEYAARHLLVAVKKAHSELRLLRPAIRSTR